MASQEKGLGYVTGSQEMLTSYCPCIGILRIRFGGKELCNMGRLSGIKKRLKFSKISQK